jgi:L-amino acid N-acyltransferase YncA
MIRNVHLEDALDLARIYNHYILESTITFEEVVVDGSEMKRRIETHDPNHWLVFEYESTIVAFAYAKPWKDRTAYRHSMEISVYVEPNHHRKGIARSLYQELLERLKKNQTHAVLAGITLPNPTSIQFHESMGFSQVAHFKETGFKFNQWIDVGYWERILE